VRKRHQRVGFPDNEGGIVCKSTSPLTKVLGAASLLFMGYVILTALPDLRRYIKISMM
jgi:hypothetical protein